MSRAYPSSPKQFETSFKVELEALIFDVDGTLAETEELHRQAFNEAFSGVGLDWCWDRALYRDLLRVTGGKERVLFYATKRSSEERRFAEKHVRDIHALKTERYVALVAAGAAVLRPGVARLVREARSSGLKLAIATTTSPQNVAALLRSTLGDAAEDLFHTIAAGDMVARKKPWPDIYQLALGELGLGAQSCVAFEDSQNGVLAARRAGLEVVVTPGIYTMDEQFDGALCVLSDLGEPHRPYDHVCGIGAGEQYVTVSLLQRWTEPARIAGTAATQGTGAIGKQAGPTGIAGE